MSIRGVEEGRVIMRKDELELMNKQYDELFLKYGDTEKSVGWNKPKQSQRFQIIFNMIYKALRTSDREDLNVLDLGSGLGHFYEEMVRREHKWNYTGIDANRNFISECKKKFPEAQFTEALINSEAVCEADVIIASGLFNRKFENIEGFIEEIFTIAMEKCKLILCFNFLHIGAIKQYEHNYYTSISMLECLIDRSKIRGWEIDGLSLPGEFTLGCYK